MRGKYLLIQGNALSLPLASESVHAAITSPPYWGLRDYQCEGQLGLERSISEHVENMVAVFREVKRVLRRDGVLWLNYGDAYANSPGNGRGGEGERLNGPKPHHSGVPHRGLPAKNLLGMPWRIAFALQDDGWVLRAEVIYCKQNPLPESVRDRPSRAHEHLFMLTKAATYYYDDVAVREPAQYGRREWPGDNYRSAGDGQLGPVRTIGGNGAADPSTGRNWRSFLLLPTEPFSAADCGITDADHFATMPTALVEKPILAAPGSVCSACGAPWRRVVERTFPSDPLRPIKDYKDNGAGRTWTASNASRSMSGQELNAWKLQNPDVTIDWEPTCSCSVERVPALILDPFAGSGTVGVVALKHNRSFLGIDLSAKYLRIAQARIRQSLAGKPIDRTSKPAPTQLALEMP